jgi:hypothetical protein
LTISTVGSLNHGLGRKPDLVQVRIKCNTANNGYSVGDELPIDGAINASRGISTWMSATQVGYATNGANQITIVPKGGGAPVTITDTQWRIILTAIKFGA